jgi:hypothetical protein
MQKRENATSVAFRSSCSFELDTTTPLHITHTGCKNTIPARIERACHVRVVGVCCTAMNESHSHNIPPTLTTNGPLLDINVVIELQHDHLYW